MPHDRRGALLDCQRLVDCDGNHRCHPEALLPLRRLMEDARAEGFEIAVASAFRDVEHQARIVERKFTGALPVLDRDEHPLDISTLSAADKIAAICVFSSIPGFSRHHLGSDFDIYPRNLLPQGQTLQLTAREYDEHEPGGYFHPFLDYLHHRLGDFGFFTPYSGENGMGYEPWHISCRSLASRLLRDFSPGPGLEWLRSSDLTCREAAADYAAAHYRQLLALDA